MTYDQSIWFAEVSALITACAKVLAAILWPAAVCIAAKALGAALASRNRNSNRSSRNG